MHGGLTISVNNNWFNGFNLDSVRSFLSSELEAVRAALEHLRQDMLGEGEWERQCELAMRTNSGLNVTDFASIVVARAIFLLSDEKRSRGTGATVERTGWASITGESESDFRESRGDSGGGDRGVWHEERWKVFALEKIAAALRDLSTAPFVNHVFLDDAGLVDDSGIGTPDEHTDDGLREGARAGRGSVGATLACVERYLHCSPDTEDRKN